MARSLMVVGTASDVGKSVVCTALCRIFSQDGYRVAPFKGQNMSLNSAVTPSGAEIGRAQAVQAEACGILPSEHMNPVLLKPTNEHRTQVIVQGRVHATISARDYFHSEKSELWKAVVESLRYLQDHYELVVMEGAGSPVEMNLKERDITNMRAAEMADAAVLLVVDIERGGVFAAVVGTLALLAPHERNRVKGIIINKFRGDPRLFDEGVTMLQNLAGIPVLGVIPFMADLGIEAEDSLALAKPRYQRTEVRRSDILRIVVVNLPHLANFTDLDPLFLEFDAEVSFTQTPSDLEGSDAVVLGGTKNTMDDLVWLEQTGWMTALQKFALHGGSVLGICGGFQMMGQRVVDPTGQESNRLESPGIGLFSYHTVLTSQKRTRLVEGVIHARPYQGISISGYEIHMGETTDVMPDQVFAVVGSHPVDLWSDGVSTGDGAIVGTYLHGIFHNDAFRTAWLNRLRLRKGMPERPVEIRTAEVKAKDYDRLAHVVRSHLDMQKLYHILADNRAAERGAL